MSAYSETGSAGDTCELTITPYTIDLACVPSGNPTQPDDVLLEVFTFGKFDGTPDNFWIATSNGTTGDDVIDGNGLLASIDSWSGGAVAQAGNATYLGAMVYFQINGGDGNDTITGGANWDTLHGDNGDDTLNGLGASDQVNGGAGNDSVSGGDGDDWIDGGEDNDFANGNSGNDNIAGGIGTDSVDGGDGDDNLFGDTDGMRMLTDMDSNDYAPETICDSADQMNGGAGNDQMFGQGGDDDMKGDSGDDGLDGGSGNDALSGGDGIDSMTGGTGDDTMDGGTGNDFMNGNSGDDVMKGAKGADWIAGGTGDDVLIGGAGRDHFVFCDDDICGGDDFIRDFTTSRQRDQIDLTELHNLDLVVSSETGEATSAFLELICFGEDSVRGSGDDYSLGTIFIDSKQNVGRVFGLDNTFGTSANSLVRVAAGVYVDLPSISYLDQGDQFGTF